LKNYKEYCKKYGTRLLVAVLIVASLFGATTSRGTGQTSGLEKATMSLAIPARSAMTGVIGWLENIYGYMFRFDELQAENEELQAQVTELQNELRQAKTAETENEEYRKLFGMRDKYSDFSLESAKIIDRGTSNWNSTMTIGKGSECGIEIGDCVIDSSYNVVGQVCEVGEGWATIRTVIDTDINIGALVGDTGSAAMVIGDYELMLKGLVKLTYLTEGAQVFEGDTLLTSGKGGNFPRGLVIGTVTEVSTEAGGQVEYACVEPAVNPYSLTQIFIVKDFTVVE
jgi:rod shape-determining protein MreC